MLQHNLYTFISGLLISALSFAFVGCTETINLDTNDTDPVIVIYGLITDVPAYQEVQVSSSTGYFDDAPNAKISGAKVSISTDDGEIYNLKEVASTPGIYKTTELMSGAPGKTYHLTVKTDFNNDGADETYEAETKMPEKVELDSINITSQKVTGYKFFSINMYAQEPAGENYYMCRYQINDSLYTQISKYIIFDDLSLDNQYIKGLSLSYFADLEDKSRYSDDDIKDMAFIASGDSVKVLFSNISKAYYNFLTQCQEEIDGENPFFGGPLSNIDTNISNGGIGYFGAYCVSEAAGVAPEKEE
ncbi:DUF4249 domain-containing protein [uncultured Bacteroides sp.]|uniref:DUF4249 domain-containing protein n=1 Tax=uncultured Bacteroides sp. TaxID=162156 RepID=UPI002AA7F1F8|nr:DUF4249 domain-containing protein [uncultured Bacteroides sp.]